MLDVVDSRARKKKTANAPRACLLIVAVACISIIFIRVCFNILASEDYTDISKLQATKKLSYSIMIDMGSSGSRIYVYTYVRNKKGTLCSMGRGGEYSGIQLMEGFEKLIADKPLNEKKPGISSVAKEPYDVATYFKGLLEFASKLVPDEEHVFTPIFAFATAGLRSLAETQNERIFDDDDLDHDHMLDADDDDFNKGKIAKTLFAIRVLFHNSTFDFHDSNVKILTGEEEATYDWVSLQQMMHNGRKKQRARSVQKESAPHTMFFIIVNRSSFK